MTTKITKHNVNHLANAGLNWEVKTSSFTGQAGYGYFINSSGGAVTLTLPATAEIGDIVEAIIITAGNTVTVARNSHKINGATADQTIDNDGDSIKLVYANVAEGWKVIRTSVAGTFITATGGTVTTDGDFKIHAFNSSSNFVVSAIGNSDTVPDGGPATVNYLVVAGGGGGGTRAAAGAGAGGYRTNYPTACASGLAITAQTYPITVGAGGTSNGPVNAEVPGNQGANSIFSTITSAGGGGGKGGCTPYEPVNSRSNGGSGGGGGPSGPGGPLSIGGTGNTPPVSPPQGNNGGSNTGVHLYNGSGGGGASAAGGNAKPSGPGNGGAGSPNAITGSAVTYAGGGGGGSWPSPSPAPGGTGGAGGGGHGRPGTSNPAPSNPNGPKNGTANTGGGGGGEGGGDAQLGGTGGSGIVIIRYKYQ